MPLIVRAFPVTQGREEVMKFTDELKHRRASEMDTFYQRFGVSHEAVFWQETPHGPLLIVFTELGDPTEATKRYALANDPFESWFKSEIQRLTGVDLNQTPAGPPSEKIFEWPDVESD